MRPSLPLLAALAALLPLASAAASDSGRVEVPLAMWESLQPPLPPEPEAIGPFVEARHVVFTRRGDEVAVEVHWELDTVDPGRFEGWLTSSPMHVEEVLWNGSPARATWETSGLLVSERVSGPVTITLKGSLPDALRAGGYSLSLLPAAIGTARYVGEGTARFDAGEAPRGPDGAAWTSGHRLGFRVLPSIERRERDALVLATVGLGLSLDDTDLHGRARVRWAMRHGEADRFAVDVRGLGDDLAVTGANLRAWRLEGDRLHVELQAPTRSAATVELAWTSPLPRGLEATVAVPELRPRGVFRTTTALQIARDDDIEAVPELDGWSSAPLSALPRWARDLTDGTPTAAFGTSRAGARGTLRLLRFEPVEGPPAVVDIADVVVAATQEGRALIRGRYEVLNDRAAHLDVLLPPGGSPLSVRVDGIAVRPVLIDGGLRIPLLRSVETVEGLISFPVEVAVLVDGDEEWTRREKRGLELPRLSVPVAVHRTTLHLPPGWSDDDRGTPDGRVNGFSRGEGVAYGLGKGGAVTGADRDKVDQADALFQSAVGAWKDNRFDEAQGYLDDLGEIGAENFNTTRLQSNLDALAIVDVEVGEGEDEPDDGGLVMDGRSGGEDGMSYYRAPAAAPKAPPAGDQRVLRRIKDQAMARAEQDRRTLEEATREAEEAERAGDYEKAEEKYAQALEAGKKVGRLAQTESVDMAARVREVEARGRYSKKKAKAAADPEPVRRNPDLAVVDESVEFDFATTRGPAPARLRAVTRAVLPPEVGDVVLYQHLLLPADAPMIVDVRARRSPRNRSSR